MRLYALSLFVAAAAAQAAPPIATQPTNPLPFGGWYADPEIREYDSVFWVFPTTSIVFEDQKWFDAFSSPDLVNWTKHPNILTTAAISWAQDSLWAPASIRGADGRYYFYFSANGLRSQDDTAGLGVAVADSPEVSCPYFVYAFVEAGGVEQRGRDLCAVVGALLFDAANLTDGQRHAGSLQ